MGCAGSKAGANRVVPIASNPDDDAVALQDKGKAAWGDVGVKGHKELTDEERSNNTTPPRSAGGDTEVSPVDCEEPRTPEDVNKVEPVNLDNLLAEAASMFPETPKDSSGRDLEHLKDVGAAQDVARSSPGPPKQEVSDTTTCVSPWKSQGVDAPDYVPLPKTEEGEIAIPHWERQEPLPARPGTSSRRPESSSGRLVVYKTTAQKKAEEAARRKRLEAADAGLVARPGTSSRKMSALPPVEERMRQKMAAAAAAADGEVAVVGDVNEGKGGASWELDAAGFVPEPCLSPVKKVRAAAASQQAQVFTMDDDEDQDLDQDNL